jgi:hypothetical protein
MHQLFITQSEYEGEEMNCYCKSTTAVSVAANNKEFELLVFKRLDLKKKLCHCLKNLYYTPWKLKRQKS